jgi:hypothetical protein
MEVLLTRSCFKAWLGILLITKQRHQATLILDSVISRLILRRAILALQSSKIHSKRGILCVTLLTIISRQIKADFLCFKNNLSLKLQKSENSFPLKFCHIISRFLNTYHGRVAFNKLHNNVSSHRHLISIARLHIKIMRKKFVKQNLNAWQTILHARHSAATQIANLIDLSYLKFSTLFKFKDRVNRYHILNQLLQLFPRKYLFLFQQKITLQRKAILIDRTLASLQKRKTTETLIKGLSKFRVNALSIKLDKLKSLETAGKSENSVLLKFREKSLNLILTRMTKLLSIELLKCGLHKLYLASQVEQKILEVAKKREIGMMKQFLENLRLLREISKKLKRICYKVEFTMKRQGFLQIQRFSGQKKKQVFLNKIVKFFKPIEYSVNVKSIIESWKLLAKINQRNLKSRFQNNLKETACQVFTAWYDGVKRDKKIKTGSRKIFHILSRSYGNQIGSSLKEFQRHNWLCKSKETGVLRLNTCLCDIFYPSSRQAMLKLNGNLKDSKMLVMLLAVHERLLAKRVQTKVFKKLMLTRAKVIAMAKVGKVFDRHLKQNAIFLLSRWSLNDKYQESLQGHQVVSRIVLHGMNVRDSRNTYSVMFKAWKFVVEQRRKKLMKVGGIVKLSLFRWGVSGLYEHAQKAYALREKEKVAAFHIKLGVRFLDRIVNEKWKGFHKLSLNVSQVILRALDGKSRREMAEIRRSEQGYRNQCKQLEESMVNLELLRDSVIEENKNIRLSLEEKEFEYDELQNKVRMSLLDAQSSIDEVIFCQRKSELFAPPPPPLPPSLPPLIPVQDETARVERDSLLMKIGLMESELNFVNDRMSELISKNEHLEMILEDKESIIADKAKEIQKLQEHANKQTSYYKAKCSLLSEQLNLSRNSTMMNDTLPEDEVFLGDSIASLTKAIHSRNKKYN